MQPKANLPIVYSSVNIVFRRLIAGVTALLVCLPAIAAIEGTYDIEFKNLPFSGSNATLTVETDEDGEHSLELEWPNRKAKLSDVIVKDESISFKETRKRNDDEEVVFNYEAKVDENKISGTVVSALGTTTFQGELKDTQSDQSKKEESTNEEPHSKEHETPRDQ